MTLLVVPREHDGSAGDRSPYHAEPVERNPPPVAATRTTGTVIRYRTTKRNQVEGRHDAESCRSAAPNANIGLSIASDRSRSTSNSVGRSSVRCT